jgi:hypothetical protein
MSVTSVKNISLKVSKACGHESGGNDSDQSGVTISFALSLLLLQPGF